MYRLAAYQPLWRLKLGGWVTLKDGFFLDPQLTAPTAAAAPPQPHAPALPVAPLLLPPPPAPATRVHAAGQAPGGDLLHFDDDEEAAAQPQPSGGSEAALAVQQQGAAGDKEEEVEESGGVLGRHALAFLLLHMPILDVPWRVAQSLRASEAQVACMDVSPSSVRALLRQHAHEWAGRRLLPAAPAAATAAVHHGVGVGTTAFARGLHQQAQQQPRSWVFTLPQLTQLLAFCLSDVWLGQPTLAPAAAATAPAPAPAPAPAAGSAANPSLAAAPPLPALLNLAANNLQDLLSTMTQALDQVLDPDAAAGGAPAAAAAAAGGRNGGAGTSNSGAASR